MSSYNNNSINVSITCTLDGCSATYKQSGGQSYNITCSNYEACEELILTIQNAYKRDMKHESGHNDVGNKTNSHFWNHFWNNDFWKD